jgi:uncharacterized protein (TIGR03000 family)
MPGGNLMQGGMSRGSAVVNAPSRASSLPSNLDAARIAARHPIPNNGLAGRTGDVAKLGSVTNHPARATIGSAAAVGTLHSGSGRYYGNGWYHKGWCHSSNWYWSGSLCHSHLSIGFGFYPGFFAGWSNPWLDCLWGYSLAYPACGDFYGPIYYPPPVYDVIEPLAPTGPERLPNMPKEANVQVILPDPSVVVWLDDHRTTSTGREREYATPPLQPGKKYTYTVTAMWERNGEVLTEERRVAVVAGRTTFVDLTGTAMASRDGK